MTTQDCIELFLLNCDAKGLTFQTFRYYRDKLKIFHNDIQVINVTDITATHIRMHLKHLNDRGMSSHSCHTHAKAIRAFFNFCVDDGYLSSSPCDKVSMPKRRKIKPIILNDAEIKLVLSKCLTLRDKLILSMSLDTGLRANELVTLNFENIQDTKVFVLDGKGQKDRVVFIGKKTILLLAKYRIDRDKPNQSEPLFIGQTGKRLTPSGLMQIYQRLRSTTKLSKLTSHTIRRTALTLMLKSGMSIYHLKEIAGHEDIRTLQHYINIDDDLQASHSKHGVVDHL